MTFGKTALRCWLPAAALLLALLCPLPVAAARAGTAIPVSVRTDGAAAALPTRPTMRTATRSRSG